MCSYFTFPEVAILRIVGWEPFECDDRLLNFGSLFVCEPALGKATCPIKEDIDGHRLIMAGR